MKEWKATNEDFLKRVDLLSKEKAKKEEEHVEEMEKVIVEGKSSAAMAVWETKIKLVKEIANTGSWDLAGRREALAKLTSKLVNNSHDPEGQLSRVDEVEKTTSDDNQLTV